MIWDLSSEDFWDMGPLGYGTPCDAAPSDLRPPPRTGSTGVWWLRGFGAVCRPLSPSSLPRGPQGWHTGDSGLRWLWGAVALGCGGFGVRWLWVLTGGGWGCGAAGAAAGTRLSPGALCPRPGDGDVSVLRADSPLALPVPREQRWGHVCPRGSVTPDLAAGPRLPLARGHQGQPW